MSKSSSRDKLSTRPLEVRRANLTACGGRPEVEGCLENFLGLIGDAMRMVFVRASSFCLLNYLKPLLHVFSIKYEKCGRKISRKKKGMVWD